MEAGEDAFVAREDMPGTQTQAEITGMERRRWMRGSPEAEPQWAVARA